MTPGSRDSLRLGPKMLWGVVSITKLGEYSRIMAIMVYYYKYGY